MQLVSSYRQPSMSLDGCSMTADTGGPLSPYKNVGGVCAVKSHQSNELVGCNNSLAG